LDREEQMATSRYIARLMGPVLLIIGIGMVMGMLTEGDGYSSLLKEFIGSRALIFITGVLALVAGVNGRAGNAPDHDLIAAPFNRGAPSSRLKLFRGEPQERA